MSDCSLWPLANSRQIWPFRRGSSVFLLHSAGPLEAALTSALIVHGVHSIRRSTRRCWSTISAGRFELVFGLVVTSLASIGGEFCLGATLNVRFAEFVRHPLLKQRRYQPAWFDVGEMIEETNSQIDVLAHVFLE